MKTLSRFTASATAFVLVLGIAVSAFAGPPTDYVKKKTEAVTSLLAKKDSKRREKKLKKMVQQTIDFRELASRALGDNWTKRTPDEQQQFLDLLQELLQANYEGKLEGKRLGKDYTVKYDDEKTRGDKAIVKTTVVAKKQTKPVEYKLVKKDDGWTIFDVVIDDISLVETYRDSYNDIINKEGWDSLIQKMKDKNKELRAAARAPRKKAKAKKAEAKK